MRTLSLVLAAAAFAIASAAPKRDGGFELNRLIMTDGGYLDSGVPFNGFELNKPLTAKGDLSAAEIQPVVKAHQGEINTCYLALLKRNGNKQPVPQGKAMLQFEVAPDGKVASAAVAPGGIDEKVFSECVVERVKAWVFPAPRGGGPVKVNFPVKLLPPDTN